MKLKYCALLLVTAVFSSTVLMAADEITITHRSGKVQTIRIENPDDPVEQVSFRRDSKVTPEKQQTVIQDEQVKPTPVNSIAKDEKAAVTPAEQPVSKSSSGIKVKWAPPVDVLY